MVSPTSVAAPCRLEETAMEMMNGTGLAFSFRQMERPMGAIISTVATLSTKAEMTPAKSESATAAHLTLGTRSIIRSERSIGIRLSVKSATSPMVPMIMSRTLKSMDGRIFSSGNIPVQINTSPEVSAMQGRYLPNISMST